MDRFPLLFRAVADPTRLRIMAVLDGGATCVGDLADALGSPQPTTSRHLACLRRAGLVETRPDGPWSFYSLARADGRVDRELRRCLRAIHDPANTQRVVDAPHVDALSRRVTDGRLVKVLAWYDNEWGYANRLAELARLVARAVEG